MSTYDWFSKQLDPTPRTYKRSGPFTESLKTVAEALKFCEQHGLDPDKARLAHNYVLWEAPETPEEVQERIDLARKHQQHHLEMIRKMYEEYTERGLYDA